MKSEKKKSKLNNPEMRSKPTIVIPKIKFQTANPLPR